MRSNNMKTYKVIAGTYTQNGKAYKKGMKVKSKTALATAFPFNLEEVANEPTKDEPQNIEAKLTAIAVVNNKQYKDSATEEELTQNIEIPELPDTDIENAPIYGLKKSGAWFYVYNLHTNEHVNKKAARREEAEALLAKMNA